MRSLVVDDLHYSLLQLDWLLSAAPGFDPVILAGDDLNVRSSADFRVRTVMKSYLAPSTTSI
jgi:hypothetical protein